MTEPVDEVSATLGSLRVESESADEVNAPSSTPSSTASSSSIEKKKKKKKAAVGGGGGEDGATATVVTVGGGGEAAAAVDVSKMSNVELIQFVKQAEQKKLMDQREKRAAKASQKVLNFFSFTIPLSFIISL